MDADQSLLLNPGQSQLLVDILLKSSKKCPVDMLNAEPHPSDLTLAMFAELVYTEKKSSESDEAYGARILSGKLEGWRLLTVTNTGRSNGYFGAAFAHTGSQQVVVAHRGTDLSSVGALYTDVQGILCTQYTSCMSSAATIVDQIRQAINVANKQRTHYTLAITGHSLGAWLAQLTAFSVKYLAISHGFLTKNPEVGIHAKTVGFDSPGARDMLDQVLDDYYDRYEMNAFLDGPDITLYLSAPNHVNTHGMHLGTIYRVEIDLSSFNFIDKSTIKYTFKTHAMSNFVDAFKDENKKIYKVSDWAKSIEEFIELFNILKWDNKYHGHAKVDDKDFLKKIHRYKVAELEPQENVEIFEISFRVFSVEEFQVLYKLHILQEQKSELTILSDFIKKNNLDVETNKLFPNFDIHFHNRTITFESRESSAELCRRLKQLMRWLKPQFQGAVEEQIKFFHQAADFIYYAEGQSYLASLPECWLDFADSVGFRDFLVSGTERILLIVTNSGGGAFQMTRLQNILHQFKRSVDSSDCFIKYISESYYMFLEWCQLQKLAQIYGWPINKERMMVVDSTSSSITMEDRITLINHVHSNSMKLVLILTQPLDTPDSSEFLKTVNSDCNVRLTDLTPDSQEIMFARDNAIIFGDKGYSFRQFLGDDCSILDINKILSPEVLKNFVSIKNYTINIKDTRPTPSDLQMPLFKTNLKTNIKCILNWVESPNTLVVVSGLSRAELDTGADWEQLAQKDIFLAEGDVQLSFKYICNKNQHKRIYLFDVSEGEVYCKCIFDRGFYVCRKFNHRAHIDVGEFAKTKHADDLFVICSEEEKTSLLGVVENCAEKKSFTENVFIAATKETEIEIIQKYSIKNIHFVKICQNEESYKFEWRYSHGSVKNLRPYVSTDPFNPIDEPTLSQTERSLVMITDEPGMGKTTSLATLSWRIKTKWVICIELKQFKEYIVSLSNDLTPENVAKFLLSECVPKADGNLVYGLLVYLLQSKTCSKRVVIMFDGFDEVDDVSKDKLVKLFAFLHSKPTIQVFVTFQNYLKDSLEGKLNHISTSFVTINTQEQQDFLFMFWSSSLSLELRDYGEEVKGRLKEYAGEVLREAKEVLGADMVQLMGIPLQLRMLAEVFRPKSDLLVQSLEDLCKQINIVSAPNLYKRFVNLKYEIYLHKKTNKGTGLDDEDIMDSLEPFTKLHGEIGFRTFFTNFYDLNKNDFKNISEKRLEKLNRIGLMQSNRNGDFQFIHRTYAEYFCAQMVVRWLNKQSSITNQLIKQILIPQLLLHRDYKTIRLFLNTELNLKPVSKIALESTAKYISQLWLEDSSIFRNQEEHRTALHIAFEERNEHIITLLLSGLNIESAKEAFVCYITQYDRFGKLALDVVGMRDEYDNNEDGLLLKRIMTNFLRCVETCSNEIKEKVYFATFFNQDSNEIDPSNILVDLDFIIPNISVVFERLKEVYVESELFMKAVLANNIILMKEILSDQLKNNIERCCLLLRRQPNYSGQTVYDLAVRWGYLDVVKLLTEQTYVPFAIVMEEDYSPLDLAAALGHLDIVKYLMEWGADKEAKSNTNILTKYTPTYFNDKYSRNVLHAAAGGGHLPIVKYLLKSGADIHAINNGSETALHVAAEGDGHLLVVEHLLQEGVDPDRVTWQGYTALTVASLWEQWDVVQLLLERGADPNADGGKALSWAIQYRKWSVVKSFVDKGTSVHESIISRNISEFKEKFPNYKFKEE